MTLTNAFDIGDQNITLENYDSWLTSLNQMNPTKVTDLKLTECKLQTFLDEVFEIQHSQKCS